MQYIYSLISFLKIFNLSDKKGIDPKLLRKYIYFYFQLTLKALNLKER